MRLLVLLGFGWLLGFGFGWYMVRLSFTQTLRLSSVKHDCRLVLMFFICEKDCSHAYVEPNMVNTAILTHCSVWYVTGSMFQVLTISWVAAGSAGWSCFYFCPLLFAHQLYLLLCKSFQIFIQWHEFIHPHVWGLHVSNFYLRISDTDARDVT